MTQRKFHAVCTHCDEEFIALTPDDLQKLLAKHHEDRDTLVKVIPGACSLFSVREKVGREVLARFDLEVTHGQLLRPWSGRPWPDQPSG